MQHELPRVFEPEAVEAMGIAFERPAAELGPSLTRDATESAAKVIIELAERGATDPERLYEGALAHFSDPAARESVFRLPAHATS